MKSTLLVIAAIFIGFITSAQEYQYVSFPDSNAVWSEYYWSSESPAVYNKYALFNEDTVINGRTYQKVFHTVNSSTISPENSVYMGGIREDSLKRIYAVGLAGWFSTTETEEILLYDFSLNEGDTIRSYIPDTVTANFTAEYLVVENIDTILIHTTLRKVFTFYNYPWTRWIEGIGNIQGLIFPSGDLTTGGDNSELICMHQNDTLMFFNEDYENCVPQFVIDNVALLPNHEIKVYPNPVTGGKVYFENLQFETLKLFNAQGQLIKKINVEKFPGFVLNTAHLKPGIYTYLLAAKGYLPTRGKLIVE